MYLSTPCMKLQLVETTLIAFFWFGGGVVTDDIKTLISVHRLK